MDISLLPKVELHCHLDGILSPNMAETIRHDYPDFPITPESFAPYLPVTDLESFWGWWGVMQPLDGNLRAYQLILAQYVEQLKAQHVRYFEVMISSGELPSDPAAAVDAVAATRELIAPLEAGQIQVEFIIAFGRTHSVEKVARIAEKIQALHRAGLIVGVALAGKEQGHPVAPFRKFFQQFHDAGLKIEIHAGEWVGAESGWDALENGFPDRIGHGVQLFEDERLIDEIAKRDIHLEICPTSNIKTGSVSRIEQHPIAKAHKMGLNFSINTDDPGPFECSMNSEYQLIADTFGFTEVDFAQIYANSLRSRFQPQLRTDST